MFELDKRHTQSVSACRLDMYVGHFWANVTLRDASWADRLHTLLFGRS